MSDERAREQAELDRVAQEYRRRDAAKPPPLSAWSDPVYVSYMQELEWQSLRALRDLGLDLTGGRVLDVGCGTGYFLHRLQEYGAAEAHGIDLMPERVAAAASTYPGLTLTSGSATELPYEADSFDLVTQFTCLSSVLDGDVRARIAGEMWRVTRRSGTVLSFDMRPLPSPFRQVWATLTRRRRPQDAAPTTPVVPLSARELRRLFPGNPAIERPLVLHPELTALLGSRRLLVQGLGAVPLLRTHLLAVFRKG